MENTKSKSHISRVRYISDEKGRKVSAVIPIKLWEELESEKETQYILNSKTLTTRLLKARKRNSGTSLEDAREKLGI